MSAYDWSRRVSVDIRRHNDVESREASVRIYGSSPGRVALQLRAMMRLHDGSAGRDFVIAHAELSRDELLALRAAIDVQLFGADK